ncbi:uncharacterized protein [Dysidea avara]|uniref:uncharacterized protein n=1 Tax=Dysidea avara TaxID=196820 RepID=UPI00332EFFAE
MATRGGIGEFSGEAADWESYIERLENYFVAHEITDAANLVVPQKPNEVEYAALVKRINEHFVPKSSVIVQRFKFNTCVRQVGESVLTFVAHLRALSEHCEFGDTLEDMLRDRLICGIADSRMQRAMLAEQKLKFARAFELTQTMESADRDTRKLQSNTSVHLLTDKSTTTKPCYCCGERHHPSSCRFVDAICHACKKTGHISKVCRSKRKTTAAGGNTTKTGGTKSNTSTSVSQSSKSSTQSEPKAALTLTATPEDVYTMFSIHGPGHAPFYVTLAVDGHEL